MIARERLEGVLAVLEVERDSILYTPQHRSRKLSEKDKIKLDELNKVKKDIEEIKSKMV